MDWLSRKAPSPKLKADIVHFTIPVSDLDRSEQFYREILGLETVSRAPEPVNLLFMKSGEDYVVLAKSKTPINPNPGDERFIHHAFGVALDKYEESRAFLEEKGVHASRVRRAISSSARS